MIEGTASGIRACILGLMETEKLPLRQAFFGLIFAAIFLAVGAFAVSASYDNDGGSHGSDHSEEKEHSEEDDSHDDDGDADHSDE